MTLQDCSYCGGVYVRRAASQREMRNLLGTDGGSQPQRWHVYVCSGCGHVEMFYTERAEEKPTA